MAEGISQPPRFEFGEPIALCLADVRCTDELGGVGDIAVVRRNVVVAADDDVLVGGCVGVKMLAESTVPR